MTRTILVVAAHPDDEVLGCGGTIARHAAEGDAVHILIVAGGAMSRSGATEEDVEILRQAAEKGAGVLGAKPPHFLELPDNRLDSVDLLDVIQKIESFIEKVKPSTIYTHHGGDLNSDHRIVHEAVVTACRPVPGSTVRQLFTFETLSSTEWATPSMGPAFSPTHFIDIADTLADKEAALKSYDMEMRPFPHPRSIDAVTALATLRGAQSGLMAAEAFSCLLDVATRGKGAE